MPFSLWTLKPTNFQRMSIYSAVCPRTGGTLVKMRDLTLYYKTMNYIQYLKWQLKSGEERHIFLASPCTACVLELMRLSLLSSRCLFDVSFIELCLSFNLNCTFIDTARDPVTSVRRREDHYFQKGTSWPIVWALPAVSIFITHFPFVLLHLL